MFSRPAVGACLAPLPYAGASGSSGQRIDLRRWGAGAQASVPFALSGARGEIKRMPRRGTVPHRLVLPDPKYNNRNITRLVGRLMWDGKRSVAERIVYDALELVEQR